MEDQTKSVRTRDPQVPIHEGPKGVYKTEKFNLVTGGILLFLYQETSGRKTPVIFLKLTSEKHTLIYIYIDYRNPFFVCVEVSFYK